MATYADWLFYSDDFQGVEIEEADFSRLALRASAAIDRLTFGRAAAVITEGTDTDTIQKIRMATCAVAEVSQKQSQDHKAISSESVGGHSVSYVTSDEDKFSWKAKERDAASLWLADTGLMYRGFNEDEYARNMV